jgi:hypothetical protein
LKKVRWWEVFRKSELKGKSEVTHWNCSIWKPINDIRVSEDIRFVLSLVLYLLNPLFLSFFPLFSYLIDQTVPQDFSLP